MVGYHQDLELHEVDKPEPTGPFDVIVRIGGAGVCRTDLHILEGQWAEKSNVESPYTIGHENAGWVDAVGAAVTNVAEGDKVIVHPLVTCGLCRACRPVTTSTARTASSRGSTPTAGTPSTSRRRRAAW